MVQCPVNKVGAAIRFSQDQSASDGSPWRCAGVHYCARNKRAHIVVSLSQQDNPAAVTTMNSYKPLRDIAVDFR
jgi:hypothetical protein